MKNKRNFFKTITKTTHKNRAVCLILAFVILMSAFVPLSSVFTYAENTTGSTYDDVLTESTGSYNLSSALDKERYKEVSAVYFPGTVKGMDIGINSIYATQQSGRAVTINTVFSPRALTGNNMALFSDGTNSLYIQNSSKKITWYSGAASNLVSNSDVSGNFISSFNAYKESTGTTMTYSHRKVSGKAAFSNPGWDLNTVDDTRQYIDSTSSRIAGGRSAFINSDSNMYIGSNPSGSNKFSGLIGKSTLRIYGPSGAGLDISVTMIPCIEKGNTSTKRVSSWSSVNDITVVTDNTNKGKIGFYVFKTEYKPDGNNVHSEEFITCDDFSSLAYWGTPDIDYLEDETDYLPIGNVKDKNHRYCELCGLYYDDLTASQCPEGHTLIDTVEHGEMIEIIDKSSPYINSVSDDVLNQTGSDMTPYNRVTYSSVSNTSFSGYGLSNWNDKANFTGYITGTDGSTKNTNAKYTIEDGKTGIKMEYDINSITLRKGQNGDYPYALSVDAKTGNLSNTFTDSISIENGEYVYSVNKSDSSTFVSAGLRINSFVNALLNKNNYPTLSADLDIKLYGNLEKGLPDLYFGYQDIDQGQAVRVRDRSGSSIINSSTRFYYSEKDDTGHDPLSYTYLESANYPNSKKIGGYSYIGNSVSKDGEGTKADLNSGWIYSDGSYGMDGGTVYVKIPSDSTNTINIKVDALWSQEAVLGITPYTTGFKATYVIPLHKDKISGENVYPYSYFTDDTNNDSHHREENIINGYDTSSLGNISNSNGETLRNWSFSHFTADRPVTVNGTVFPSGTPIKINGRGIKDLEGIEILDQNVTFTAHFVQREPYVNLKYTKIWDDDHDRDGIRPDTGFTVTVKRNSSDKPNTYKTLNIDKTVNDSMLSYDNMTVSFTKEDYELKRYDMSTDYAFEYTYRVSEKKVPAGYTQQTSGGKVNDAGDYDDLSFEYTQINRYSPKTLDFTIEKVWDDDNDRDGKRPDELTFSLYRWDDQTSYDNDTDKSSGTLVNKVKMYKSSSFAPVNISSADLINEDVIYRYHDHGTQYVYMIKEDETDSSLTYTSQSSGLIKSGDDSYRVTVTNTRESEKITPSATKIWDDDNDRDGRRTDIEFVLKRWDSDDSFESDPENGYEVSRKTSSASENWAPVIFGDSGDDPVYVYHDGGIRYHYEIEENAAGDGYSCEKEKSGNDFTFTNSRESELVKLKVHKEWNDDGDRDGKRPSKIYFSVYRWDDRQSFLNGDPGYKMFTSSMNVSAGVNVITIKKASLYRYHDHGTEYYYRVVEDDEKNSENSPTFSEYDSSMSGGEYESDGFIHFYFENSYTPQSRTITVRKVFNDSNDRDGKRQGIESITFDLYRTDDLGHREKINSKSMTKSSDFSDISFDSDFSGSPLYLYYDKGKSYAYDIEEGEVENYFTQSVSISDGIYTFKNRHIPEKMEFTGLKTFSDRTNAPESVSVKLKRNGTVIGTCVISEENNWTYHFDDSNTNYALYRYKSGGTEHSYEIYESPVSGFSASYGIKDTSVSGDTYTGKTYTVNQDILNTSQLGGIKVRKTDESGNTLKNAGFEITDQNGKKVSSALSDGYREVEYIENVSSRYIMTDVTADKDTGIYVEFSSDGYNDPSVIGGSMSTVSGTSYRYYISIKQNLLYLAKNSKYTSTSDRPSLINGNRYTVRYNYLDDTKSYLSSREFKGGVFGSDLETQNVSLAFFGLGKGSNASNFFIGRIYRVKITQGNSVIRDYVPCIRESDKAAGLYDRISDTFIANSGTGEKMRYGPYVCTALKNSSDSSTLFYTDESGEINITGLKQGSYTAKEKKSPSEYMRYSDSMNIDVSERDTSELDVKNSRKVMPSTGGSSSRTVFILASVFALLGIVSSLICICISKNHKRKPENRRNVRRS